MHFCLNNIIIENNSMEGIEMYRSIVPILFLSIAFSAYGAEGLRSRTDTSYTTSSAQDSDELSTFYNQIAQDAKDLSLAKSKILEKRQDSCYYPKGYPNVDLKEKLHYVAISSNKPLPEETALKNNPDKRYKKEQLTRVGLSLKNKDPRPIYVSIFNESLKHFKDDPYYYSSIVKLLPLYEAVGLAKKVSDNSPYNIVDNEYIRAIDNIIVLRIDKDACLDLALDVSMFTILGTYIGCNSIEDCKLSKMGIIKSFTTGKTMYLTHRNGNWYPQTGPRHGREKRTNGWYSLKNNVVEPDTKKLIGRTRSDIQNLTQEEFEGQTGIKITTSSPRYSIYSNSNK